ncbi:3-phosphoshikimate 1-carboxyvinyltransferase [soil metagenome]
MEITISKNTVRGSVSVPSSKSLLQRYLIASFLADGETKLRNVHHCQDTLACLNAIIPAKDIEASQVDTLSIVGWNGSIDFPSGIIYCGESGFALRALASVAALSSRQISLTGSGSLLQRPVDFFEKVFPSLGIECKSNNGFLPLTLEGPMQFRDISIDGSLSSQFLSGLLMVYPFAKEDHVIEVKNLKSKNYIDLTIQVMKDFGVNVTHEDYTQFRIPGNQKYQACNADVEGDWSAGSIMLVAGASAGEVTIKNLSMDSLQPDKSILKVLNDIGAHVQVDGNRITVRKGTMHSFSFDATDCPDLFPPLVALAIQCEGISEITGVERLIHKESNRALALQQEFSKLNDKLIDITGNKMIIRGGLALNSALVDSRHDHRIAMALAITGLNVEGKISINGAESVEKSYPEFFTDLAKLLIT